MSYKQEPNDSLDYDRFVDFDQGLLSPDSTSSKGKAAIQTPDISSQSSSLGFLAQQQNAQSMFSGPSHRYDEHTQQTGLPSGALANALAANRNTAFHMGGYSNTYSNSSGVDFDFNAAMPQQFDSTEMDVDFNTPLDGYYGSNSGFVDPNVIGGQEDLSPPPTRTGVVRMWPGMHTRQAELAKQQQQQEIQRQQQAKVGQQPSQPSQGHKRNGSKANCGAARPTDPIVEERISRLLNQMRHGSVTSSNEDNTTPQASQSQTQRSKKEEEDMDEDERLLASEEGKKLSSKERRQLRNKVSARAFRSRRKEYIGQLEGELAAKGQEADDLRVENDALKAENDRLTELTKMLLSSSAFSTFLNDLSANGMSSLPEALNVQQQSSQSQQTQQQLQAPKDTNTHRQNVHRQHHGSMQIGMTMIPETNMDFLSSANANWNTGMDYQVYTITELPQGPPPDAVDTGFLSGKTSNFVPSFSDAKDNAPVIENMPKPEVSIEAPPVQSSEPDALVVDESIDFDETNPAFALFVDDVSMPTTSAPSLEPADNIFGDIAMEKAVARFNIVIESEQTPDEDVSTAVMARFESLCSSLDAISSRIANSTWHL